MSATNSAQSLDNNAFSTDRDKRRLSSCGNAPSVLADVYQDDINIAIWERDLSAPLMEAVKDYLTANPDFSVSRVVSPKDASVVIGEALGSSASTLLTEDVAEIVAMFCYLFELKCAGLRLATLNRAMCPRFHVDRVPCRLVTTYHGVTTEWLPHEIVDRRKLGHGNGGRPDHESGLFGRQSDIRRLACGDVALLKGESWIGNENAGLVHRSPAVPAGESRLLLTLDVSD